MTHDYKRNGTTTLFAALDVLDGKLHAAAPASGSSSASSTQSRPRPRTAKSSTSSSTITVAPSTPKVRAWLDRHPRFVFHYTPKSVSWLNAVEGFFAKLTRRRLKRGVFRSLVDLQAAIKRFLAETNDSPKPLVWSAGPDTIIAPVRRGYQVLDQIY
jgi:hypothetical protein